MSDKEEKNLQTLYNRYDKFAKSITIVLSILFISQLGLGLWNLNLSSDNNTRTQEIQASRRNSILISCEEQNMRNENSISTLNELLSKTKILNSNENIQIEHTKTFTILLINALAPKQNCQERVKRLTKP